jgi:hypothetical protein
VVVQLVIVNEVPVAMETTEVEIGRRRENASRSQAPELKSGGLLPENESNSSPDDAKEKGVL